MVADIVRDSTFGQIVSYLSKGRYFPYADQRPDYVAVMKMGLHLRARSRFADAA
ncbi:hypothetical protein RHOSPDRAFT_36975 [Rhodotorula sp. JG-1b]|nr:hypothetical protein RHOSPDRAFT_36975 [Rhodotorula sp. JG-1b]